MARRSAVESSAHRVYAARWADLRAQGTDHVILSRKSHPEQWQAWLAYFQSKGLATLAGSMLKSDERAVPTWWPHDFDADEVQP